MCDRSLRIATVSTQLPLKCGIATYSHDLCAALRQAYHLTYALHYGAGVWSNCDGNANVASPEQLRNLAKKINSSGADVVNLQHEFGIWGGHNGEHIMAFIDELRLPIVSTLHTTYDDRVDDPPREAILAMLGLRSSFVVVLTPESARYATQKLKIASERVLQIPHGVPDVSYVRPTQLGNRTGALRFASIGYLRPDKGVDKTILAFSKIKQLGYAFEYLIAGGPQPQFDEQRAYADYLSQLIGDLDLSDQVLLRREFFPLEDQIRAIQSSDAAVFAYQTPFHSSSGAIPLALACGRPVLCTPIAYSYEKKIEVGAPILLTDGFTTESIARSLIALYANPGWLDKLGVIAWQHARNWQWDRAAKTYFNTFVNATSTWPRRPMTGS